MFEHPHHQKISFILDSLDEKLFRKAGAHFGGGTLITLLHDEFRFSKDIDFMCPVGDGYRVLRVAVADANFKPTVFFKRTNSLVFPREVKADQYGLRFPVLYKDQPVKFEIVAEGRIELESAVAYPWTDLPCLSNVDRFAEKLLANADRWMDESIESRDLIDLAAMRLETPIPAEAMIKAEKAYPVLTPLKKAIGKFYRLEKYREKCFNALEINNRAKILDGLDLLAADHELPLFTRTVNEEHKQ